MGLLRTILALSVAYAHLHFADSIVFIQAGIAVIIFYMISGFYMSMIITEKYKPSGEGWEKRFLLNRALRIYPPYFVVLILAVVAKAWTGQPTIFTADLGLPWYQHALAVLSNIFIVGQDWIIAGTSLNWTGGGSGLHSSWNTFPILVAWTLAVEITFYLFAALALFKSRAVFYFAFCLAVYFRFYFVFVNGKALGMSPFGIGLSNDPWGYHFFGTVLIFFLLGSFAYDIYVKIRTRMKQDSSVIYALYGYTAVLLGLIFWQLWAFGSYRNIYGYNDALVWLAVGSFWLLLPALFALSKNSRIDNYIGLYCYPIYLCHIAAYEVLVLAFGLSVQSSVWAIVGILAVGAVIVHLVEIPMERVRRSISS